MTYLSSVASLPILRVFFFFGCIEHIVRIGAVAALVTVPLVNHALLLPCLLPYIPTAPL